MAQGGKTGFDEFYDYNRSKKLMERIEKDVLELEKVFGRFTGTLDRFSKRFSQSFSQTTSQMKANTAAIKQLDKAQIESVDSIIKTTQANESLSKSGREQKATVDAINTGTKNFTKSVNDQKEKLKQLKAEFNSLDPTLKKNQTRLRQLSSELIKTDKRIKEMSRATRDSNNVLRRAEGSYNSLTAAIKRDLDLLKQIPGATDKSSAAYKRNEKAITSLQRRINSNTSALKRFDAQIGRNFRNVGNYTSALSGLGRSARNFASALGFVGGAFLLAQGVRSAIDFNLELSDAIAGVQKTTQLATDEVRELSAELSRLPTRTNLIDLLGIAKGAGRIRASNDELVGFVATVDKLIVALRDDLQGSTDEIATTIGRIATLFGERDQFGLSRGIERVGSGINELAQRTLATADNIVDFTNSVAGIANVAGFSADQILALGAAFDEFGATPKVAATAFQRFVVQVGRDVSKFAEIVGQTEEEFSQLLKDDPQKAFLTLLDAVNASGNGLQELSEAFGELDINEQRAIRAFAVLANNTDRYREILQESNKAVEEANSLAEENAIRQDTSAGAVERLKNELKALTAEGSVFDDIIKDVADDTGVFIRTLRDIDPVKLFTLNLFSLNEEMDKTRKRMQEAGKTSEAELKLQSDAFNLFERATSEGLKSFEEFEFVYSSTIRGTFPEGEKQTRALAIVQDLYNKRVDEGAQASELYKQAIEAGIKTFDDFEAVYGDHVKQQVNGDQILNRIRKLFISDTELQKGVIQKLNIELEELQKKRSAATSLDAISKIDLEIKKRREQLRVIDLIGDGYENAATAAKEFLKAQAEVSDEEFDELFGDLFKDEGQLHTFDRNLKAVTDSLQEMTQIELAEFLKEQFSTPQDDIDELIEKLDKLNAVLGSVSGIVGEVGNIFSNFSEKRIQEQEMQLEAVQERYSRELDAAKGNEAAQKAIRERQKQDEEKIQREILKEKQNAAKADKAIRIFQIAVETAQRVFEIKIRALALSILNPAAAAFATGTLIPLAIASGAAATVAVATEPIPAFAEGTESSPDGPVIINDRPRQGSKVNREVVTTPQGKSFFYDTDGPVMTDEIPKGSKIDPRDVSELTNVSDMIKDYSPVTGQHSKMMRNFESKSDEYKKYVTVNNNNSIDYNKLGEVIASKMPELQQIIFEDGGKIKKVSVKGNTKRVTGRKDLMKGSDVQKQVSKINKKLGL